MRIFILEDEIDRYPRCQLKDVLAAHDLTMVRTVRDAMRLYEPDAYDLLLLDHDMEGFYENPEAIHKNTGTWFVKWLVSLSHRGPTPSVILHSQNSTGRRAMAHHLSDAGWIWQEVPFGPAYITALKQV